LNRNLLLKKHEDPWVNLLGPHVGEVMEALNASGLETHSAWLDPYDPRDATIRLVNSRALVYEAVSGWRYGQFLSGRQGLRTQLADISYVGGGLLPDSREVAHRFANGLSAPRTAYRSVDDLRDGLDEALRLRAGA
jgi:Family of unknown function (DUF6292)